MVIFTSKKDESDFTDDLKIIVLPGKTQTNHRTQTTFSANFLAAADGFDLLVGFDKLSDLDILYCADASMYYRIERVPYLHLMRRYRAFKDLEGESFRVGKKTKILMLSHTQLNEYWSVWNTEPDRLILLPPTVAASRRKPEHRVNGTRAEMRRELGLSADDWVWITVCVQPKIKGLDRIALALRQFPRARVLVAGLTETGTPAAKKIANLARRLGVSARIKWLGHQENIPRLMAAADLFLHPARYETTGTVILEAIINGLPVITTSACGYAGHVDSAQAGLVIEEPFRFRTFLAALRTAEDAACSLRWSISGKEYGQNSGLYQGRVRAAEVILAAALEKTRAARQGATYDVDARGEDSRLSDDGLRMSRDMPRSFVPRHPS